MDIIAIYVTHANQQNADKITDNLFRQKLIAEVNSFSIKNTYVHNGTLKNTEEVVTIYKTKKWNRRLVKEAIKAIHPHDVPCIMKFDVDANSKYRNRITENVN